MEKSQKILILVLIVVFIFGATLFIVKKALDTSDKIRIGFVGPLTGEFAEFGEPARAAVELAVDEINSEGGVNGKQIDVIYENSKCDADAATQAARKLIDKEKVSAIISGVCTAELSAFGKIAADKKLVLVSYCAAGSVPSSFGKYFFHAHPSDQQQAQFAAEYLYGTLKARRVAAIYGQSLESAFKNSFEIRFSGLGGKIIAPDLAKVKSQKPDYIYIAASAKESIDILKQASELDIKIKMLGTDRWSNARFQNAATSGKFDALYIEPLVAFPGDLSQKINDKTGGKDTPACIGEAYDAAKMLAATFTKVGLDAERIQDELHIGGYTGASGQIIFDQQGDLLNPAFSVKKITKGGAKIVE